MCVCLRQARVIPNNDINRTYSVVYLPKVEGLHKVRKTPLNVFTLNYFQFLVWALDIFISIQVKVLFAGQDIDRSPFIVNVSKAMGDPTRVQARGPGLQSMGNMANKPTYFDIYTAGTGVSGPITDLDSLRLLLCLSLFWLRVFQGQELETWASLLLIQMGVGTQ